MAGLHDHNKPGGLSSIGGTESADDRHGVLANNCLERNVEMHRPRRRILIGASLVLYCTLLYVAFDLLYSAITATDPSRYRVFNSRYHHSLAANFDGYDFWGSRRYGLTTNNLGLRDAKVREVAKQPKERRILLMGDSFTEGIGLPFEQTFAGMLYQAGQDREQKVEFLNGGLSSYSPVIYLKKTQALLEDGFHFDEVVVFSDPSDVQDEATSYFCIDDDPKYRAHCNPDDLTPKRARKKSFVSTYMYVTDAIGDWIEKAIDPSKIPPPPYEFYRIDWLQPNPRLGDYFPLGIEGGIARSLQNMQSLATLLQKHGIPLTVVVYPWPAQLAHNEHENAQTALWRKFCRDRCKDFVNLFPVLYRQQNASGDWHKPLFIPGDIHFSETGNKLIFLAIAPRILDGVDQN